MARRMWFDFSPVRKNGKSKNHLEELKDYKPLTLRQVYYQLVSKGFIENKKVNTECFQFTEMGKDRRYISWMTSRPYKSIPYFKMWDDKRFLLRRIE